jgi:phosphoglycolate phosphatase-like HAD superfamily hydrolase
LNHFQIDEEGAVYVGDSKIDELTAEAAKVPFIAYKNPQLRADHHVNHFEELAAWLFGHGK